MKVDSGNSFIKYGPVVCAVETDYLIMIPVKKKCIMTLKIGDHTFFNSVNGIKVTSCKIQRFIVPSSLLDEVKEYEVIAESVRVVDVPPVKESLTFRFKPVSDNETVNIYHISDTHGLFEEPVKAAKMFEGKIDLLILNGDISSSCNRFEDVLLNYKIAFAITNGEIPCLIIRGNHDLRGEKAQFLDKLLPVSFGNPYYFVRLKNLDILVLDCGEDKEDSHREYDNLAAFHEMRLRETEFLESRLSAYMSQKTAVRRLLVSHIPVNFINNGICKGERPFNIENEIYEKWTGLINEYYKPHLYLAGHLHDTVVWKPDNARNHRKLNCATVIGSEPFKDIFDKKMHSCFISVSINNSTVIFNDSNGNLIEKSEITY